LAEALVAESRRRMNIPGLREMKDLGEKISMLTAYDYPTARLLDRAGYVTLEEMIHHVKAIVRGARGALVIGESLKEGGCAAVKLEGGIEMAPTVRAVAEADIPVVGHVGLMPQSATKVGGFEVQARIADDALALLESEKAL
jgi:3-methyl-2-oxobutanoate hydroxymethyltransferase